MTDETTILRPLQQAVTAAVAASTRPTLPVSYLNVRFDVPDDQRWLEVVWVPNNQQGDFWGNERNYRGILRLVLHWPNDGGGVYAPLALIGSIGDYFRNGRMIGPVQVYGRANVTGMIDEGEETLYPCSIRYNSFQRD